MSDRNNKLHLAQTVAIAVIAVASLTAGLSGVAANAQDQNQAPVLMAPPLSMPTGTFNANSDDNSDGSSVNPAPAATTTISPAGQNVFQWQDVPQNRQVPITRAVFDKGGYQLTDDQGETIVVPFTDQNLYVLRFGQTTGSMYFVNDGTTPTLYIPRGGYLENASAQGARWYPFPQSYDYTTPVYVGPAPSWSEWVGMGWYPDMVYYGGYYGYEPWSFGVAFDAFPGLYFSIGGRPYYGWNAYHTYYSYHSYNRSYVRDGARFGGYNAGRRGSNDFGSRPSQYGGAGGYGGHSGYGGGNAGSTGSAAGHSSGGGQAGGPYSTSTPRTFRGGQGGPGSSQGGATYGGGHTNSGRFGGYNGGYSHSSMGGRSGNYSGGGGFGGGMSGGGGYANSGYGGGGHFGGGGGGHR